MGNKADKSHGGRGHALGSSETNPQQSSSSQSTKKSKKNKNQTAHHPVYHSKEQQRAARSNLVQPKKKKLTSGLDRKEKMLHIMEAADAVNEGKKPPPDPYLSKNDNKVLQTQTASKEKNNKSSSNTSLYMAEPSSKQAQAAENRIQMKMNKKNKSSEERKNRTRDLLFGNGLQKEIDINEYDQNNNKSSSSISSPNNKTNYKSEKDVFVNNSKQAEAALNRLNKSKSSKIINSKDRKQRTMELMHGDLLKNKEEHEIKSEPRQQQYNDIDPAIAEVHQSILNLNNFNPHEKMPATAKLLRKLITNLLSAEHKDDQAKFGKLRLTNKKIKAAIVDMKYGVETLNALGFHRKQLMNEKENKMDDYMVFDFININQKGLIHVMELLNEYYPE